jgi:hypothetical protein
MDATWRMNPDVPSRLRRARMAGLIAMATVLINAVKRGLTGGYKSGAFVTGNVRSSVTRDEPDVSGPVGSINVGTNVDYALYWEVGHYNIFTRQFERVEVWMPAATSNREQMAAAYARAFQRTMESGA